MASAFSNAWKLLKQFSNPHDEPMHSKNRQPFDPVLEQQKMMERSNASFDPLMEEPQVYPEELPEGMGRVAEPFRPTEPPNPFKPTMPERGTMNPMELERMKQALIESQRGYPPEYVQNDESQLSDFEPPERDFGRKPMEHGPDASRPPTIPMSPRGSVRGKGERQAYDKPKKPDWWRHLSGE